WPGRPSRAPTASSRPGSGARSRGPAAPHQRGVAVATTEVIAARGVPRPGRRADPLRRFKYLLIAPAVFVLLLMGLFPFLYAVVVSFQKLSLLDQYTSFQGLLNYQRLLGDTRLWNAVLHTAIITAVA